MTQAVRKWPKLVTDEPTERVFGSHGFIALSRNPALQSPKRFEPSKQVREDDVWL